MLSCLQELRSDQEEKRHSLRDLSRDNVNQLMHVGANKINGLRLCYYDSDVKAHVQVHDFIWEASAIVYESLCIWQPYHYYDHLHI